MSKEFFCTPFLVDAPLFVYSQGTTEVLVVEWIQCLPPKEAVQVRFLSRTQNKRSCFGGIFYFYPPEIELLDFKKAAFAAFLTRELFKQIIYIANDLHIHHV